MKSPAFNFYSSDFLTGTTFFNNEQVGAYIRIMCLQHQQGHLSLEDIEQITNDKKVMSKFKKDENNLYYNERLEYEINKKNAYCESRANNRKKKTYEKDMKNICNSYDKHMENEIENINIYNYIINNIIIYNSLEYKKIQKIIDEFDNEEIIKAVDKSKNKNLNYLIKVLNNPKRNNKVPEWLGKEIKQEEMTQEEIEELEKEFKEAGINEK